MSEASRERAAGNRSARMRRRALARPLDLPESPRILAIRLSAMGDLLLCFPAIRALRRCYPDARLSFLTDRRFAPLLGGLEVLDSTVTLDRSELRTLRPGALRRFWSETLRRCRGLFDAVIDLQSFGETALLSRLTGAPVRLSRRYKTSASWLYTHFIEEAHPSTYMTEAHLDTLVRAGLVRERDAETTAERGFYEVSPEARAAWRARLPGPGSSSDAGAARRVAMFVGAARAEKRWPPAAFAELATRIERTHPGRAVGFVVLAGPDEQELAAATVAAAADLGLAGRVVNPGPITLEMLAAAFADADVTLSNDTGPMHLSVAAGTPTVGLFHRRLEHFTPPPPHRWIEAPPGGLTADIPVEAAERELNALLGA